MFIPMVFGCSESMEFIGTEWGCLSNCRIHLEGSRHVVCVHMPSLVEYLENSPEMDIETGPDALMKHLQSMEADEVKSFSKAYAGCFMVVRAPQYVPTTIV
jgi:hypothetical protein